MGNTLAKDRHDDTVDLGALIPQGVYTGPQDFNHQIVAQLIIERKLAPFYRPLEDYDDAWDDDRILAARKELPDPSTLVHPPGSQPDGPSGPPQPIHIKHKSVSRSGKDSVKLSEAAIYRGAVECPICFLVVIFSFQS